MWKSLQALMKKLDEVNYESLTEEEKSRLKERLLTEISFYQHERLIHLIVTAVFAILTVLAVILMVISRSVGFIVLELLLIILLIPYIVHYYRLENGVQKLYRYYDRLC